MTAERASARLLERLELLLEQLKALLAAFKALGAEAQAAAAGTDACVMARLLEIKGIGAQGQDEEEGRTRRTRRKVLLHGVVCRRFCKFTERGDHGRLVMLNVT
ncbi:hypothetical protein [Sinorhizobium meliloti]|uniref:hypothetical protein n=1 Tax=Rhizobium meliloti TaxID=382 RepID=UPI000695BBB3|nr:hypothetical protein [Sinorhizobium meliloti]